MKLRNFAVLALFAIALSVSALGQDKGSTVGPDKDIKEKESAAEAVALHWLQIVDAGNYGQAWEEAAPLLRDAISRDNWRRTMLNFRRSLGTVSSRTFKSVEYKTQLPGVPDGEYVLIQYDTSFENKKSSVETVTPMRDKDGKWKVSGYFIN